MKYESFIFQSYTLNHHTRVAEFVYSYEDGPTFAETLTLPEGVSIKKSPALDHALFALHLLLGISYFKAYCPKKIVVHSGTLSGEQAAFWNTLYTNGLGQFFYENNLDPHGVVNFPPNKPTDALVGGAENGPMASRVTSRAGATTRTNQGMLFGDRTHNIKCIVPIGGGKDSLVTIELLKKAGIPFTTYTLGKHAITEEQRKTIHAPHFTIERRIDSQLFALNTTEDAYNGHIPITAMYSFTALLLAILNGDQYIVISSERSANEGNVEYMGTTVNHQWSKSAEAEQLIRDYIHQWISPTITYFSLLRPYSELAIAKQFAQYPQWLNRFTSCNANFKIRGKAPQRWCGHCPKCAFVFIMLAPFVAKTDLIRAFGKNLLADDTLLPLYQELLGLKNFKPFECVGTPSEVRAACALIAKQGAYADDVIVQYVAEHLPPVDDILLTEVLTPSEQHAIPQPFHSTIHAG